MLLLKLLLAALQKWRAVVNAHSLLVNRGKRRSTTLLVFNNRDTDFIFLMTSCRTE